MACNPSSPEVKAEKSEVQGHPRPIQKIPGQFGIQETLFKRWCGGVGGRRKENVQFSVSAENWAAQTFTTDHGRTALACAVKYPRLSFLHLTLLHTMRS